MTDEELDRILSKEPEIEPSAEFATSVMKAVRTEAAAPPPISFPWVCAAPLLACWGLLATASIAAIIRTSGSPSASIFRLRVDWTELFSKSAAVLSTLRSVEGACVAIALLIALTSFGISWRFMIHRI
jgi:hypothetical protein